MILVFLLADMICIRDFDRNIIKIASCFNQILEIFIINLFKSIIPGARTAIMPGISDEVSDSAACGK